MTPLFRCCWRAVLAAAILLEVLPAQETALLSNRDALRLFERSVQLMDSTKVAVPELARAGEPLAENARQALAAMKAGEVRDSRLVHTFVTNLRAYLALDDAIPKPYPLPEEVRRQFTELRDALDRAQAHFQALLEWKEAALRNPDRDNLKRYAEADEKLGPPQPGNPRVVFLGDSITDAWRLNEYFGARDFVNRGISGQITGQMLGRMKADVIDLRPAAVLVLAGTNDIARGVAVSTIENNLSMIADLAAAHRITPLFASLLPVSDYHKDRNPAYEQTLRRPPATILAINNWLRAFCRERGYTYVDYFPALADSVGRFKADASADGLHPNAVGYRLMAPIALRAIEETLRAGAAPKKRRRRF